MEGLGNIEQTNNTISNGLVEWRDFALEKLDEIEKLLDEDEMAENIVESVKEHSSLGSNNTCTSMYQ
jgi:hypothetical protein